jgi:hypothetical protein
MNRKTRSGKVFKIKVNTLSSKYIDEVERGTVRMLCVPRVLPEIDKKPAIPILRKRCKVNFLRSRKDEKCSSYIEDWKEHTLEKIDNYRIKVIPSAFKSGNRCTVELILNGNKPPGRVKFGKVTVHYI